MNRTSKIELKTDINFHARTIEQQLESAESLLRHIRQAVADGRAQHQIGACRAMADKFVLISYEIGMWDGKSRALRLEEMDWTDE